MRCDALPDRSRLCSPIFYLCCSGIPPDWGEGFQSKAKFRACVERVFTMGHPLYTKVFRTTRMENYISGRKRNVGLILIHQSYLVSPFRSLKEFPRGPLCRRKDPCVGIRRPRLFLPFSDLVPGR